MVGDAGVQTILTDLKLDPMQEGRYVYWQAAQDMASSCTPKRALEKRFKPVDDFKSKSYLSLAFCFGMD